MGLEAGTTRNLNMNFLLLVFLHVGIFFLQAWSIFNKISAESQKLLERKRKGEPDEPLYSSVTIRENSVLEVHNYFCK